MKITYLKFLALLVVSVIALLAPIPFLSMNPFVWVAAFAYWSLVANGLVLVWGLFIA